MLGYCRADHDEPVAHEVLDELAHARSLPDPVLHCERDHDDDADRQLWRGFRSSRTHPTSWTYTGVTQEARSMIDRAQALAVAQEWLDAWNAHDPERVVAHFADDVVVRSPVAGQLRPGSNGELRGKDSVLSYYRDGLAASPDLRFSLVEVCTGVEDVTIVYRNQHDTLVTEALTIREDGLAREVRVSYGATSTG